MNNFQTILVAVFLAFFVFGVLIFSGVLNIGNKTGPSGITGKVVIWGTLPEAEVSSLFEELAGSGETFSIDYIKQDESSYQNNLIEAFAKDKSPDLFILTPDMVLKNSNFIYKIPYESFSKKDFQKSFVDGSDIFTNADGILGYPLLVDPLVLYYNKDILSNEGILYPPSSWDELFDFGSKLIKKNPDGSISQSMIALGQYDNINHPKDIISALLFQSGNNILSQTETGYRMSILDSNSGVSSLEQIISFYLEFSNPSKDAYSWNRSLPNSLDMFTSGKLAFYVGYASELFNIESINPNLSFDVSVMPQTKGTDIKRTYGKFYTIALSNKSKNVTSAYGVLSLINKPDFLKELGVRTSLPTATRSLLNDKPKDNPYLLTFFDSAIISRSWLDPNKNDTDSVFKELIDNSLSNRLSISGAITKASNQLDIILKNNYEE